MNYGETNAYWYLRLNGFFLINNFVIHRTDEIVHSSDIDILGIRLPYVFEEVGGQPNDWDESLLQTLNPNLMTGVICEVKTGDFDKKSLFRKEYLKYCLDRFGFMPQLSEAYLEQVFNNQITLVEFGGHQFQILKLFVSNYESNREDFIQLRIKHIRQFIEYRIQKYRDKKWQDRVLFQSDFLGEHIDRIFNEESE